MNSKKLSILTTMLLILALIYYMLGSMKHLDHSSSMIQPMHLSESIENVSSIHIFKQNTPSPADNKSEILLVQKDKQWSISSFYDAPADDDKIKNLINTLQNLEGQPRSNNPALLKQFQIEDQEALHLVLKNKSDKEIFHLLIGKSGPAYSQSFIRNNHDSQVYLVYKNIYELIGIWNNPEKTGPQAKFWYQFKILPDHSDYEQITIHNEFNELEIKKENMAPKDQAITPVKEWKLSQGPAFSLEPQKLNTWLDSLSQLMATDIKDPKTCPQTPASCWIKIQTSNNQSYELNFWASKTPQSLLVKTSHKKTLYEINSDSISSLLHPSSKWFNLEKIDFQNNSIQSIEIQHPDVPIHLSLKTQKWETLTNALELTPDESHITTYLNNLKTPQLVDTYNGPFSDSQFNIHLKMQDNSELSLEFGPSISELEMEYHPMRWTGSQNTYLISADQINNFFQNYNIWGSTSIIPLAQLESVENIKITRNNDIFEYDSKSQSNKPEWLEDFLDTLGEISIMKLASKDWNTIPDNFAIFFIEIKSKDNPIRKLALGKSPEQLSQYYISQDNPFKIYETNSELYEYIQNLKQGSTSDQTAE